MKVQMTNERRRMYLLAECVQVPDCIDLQRRVDTATRGSLEIHLAMHSQHAEPDVPPGSRCELRQPRGDTPSHPCFSTRPTRRIHNQAPDPLEHDASHRALTVRTNAPDRLDDVSSGLP